ncbi:MAG: rRNA-binding ribosome biosynthesis protein rpf2 [Peltula sp. TS41687]|nr:MAG: rRNA-binding ribosome biosynthesis protein rpf2 [Peltula sp. TS41687]
MSSNLSRGKMSSREQYHMTYNYSRQVRYHPAFPHHTRRIAKTTSQLHSAIITPRNARSKRALEKKAPHAIENPKTALFLRGSTASAIVQSAMTDLYTLKRPLAKKFSRANALHPFEAEGSASLEFFSEKNDTSLLVFGAHSKKRPHCLTFIRTFDHKILDMFELYLDPGTFRSLAQFKSAKCAVGLKPMLLFAGTPFESPTPNAYTAAKSYFVDFFAGADTAQIDVEALQYMISFMAAEETEGGQEHGGARIHMRVYMIRTKRSGQRLPRVEVEEMGPRMDFRIGRVKEADEKVMKEALRKPRGLEARPKKNIETDLVGDKVGRIHLGRQDLGKLQTRKMKGLKRAREEVGDNEGDEDDVTMVDVEDDVDVRIKRVR